MFEEGRAEAYAPAPADAAHPSLMPLDVIAKLSPEKAEQKLRAVAAAQLDVLQSVSSAHAPHSRSNSTVTVMY